MKEEDVELLPDLPVSCVECVPLPWLPTCRLLLSGLQGRGARVLSQVLISFAKFSTLVLHWM